MAKPERYVTLAPLPDAGGFARELAVERRANPRPVVLYTAPAELVRDPVRRAALEHSVECAVRFRSPLVLDILGLEMSEESPFIVEAYRAGVTLRELLDQVHEIPVPLSARIALDLCTALHSLHAFDPGDGRSLSHGALSADRVWVSDDGEVALCGLGTGSGDPADDVTAVANVLAECLGGSASPGRFDPPGVSPALASVVNRYRCRSSSVLGPLALAEAIAAGVKPSGSSTDEALRAFVDVVLPPDRGGRAERREILERVLGPQARFGGSAVGSQDRFDPKAVSAPPAKSVASPFEEALEPVLDADESPRNSTQARQGSGNLMEVEYPLLASLPNRGTVRHTPEVTLPRGQPTGRAFGVVITAVLFLAAGFGSGLRFSRIVRWSAPPPAPRVELHGSPAVTTPRPADMGRPTVVTEGQGNPVRLSPASGFLTVKASARAEVRLDGRLLGSGNLRSEIAAGRHLLEVRLGSSKREEAFTMEPGGEHAYEAP